MTVICILATPQSSALQIKSMQQLLKSFVDMRCTMKSSLVKMKYKVKAGIAFIENTLVRYGHIAVLKSKETLS